MSGSDQGKGSDVLDAQDRARFEQLVLPHLDAAFNLARWLLRSPGGTRAPGFCRLCAILVIPGWRRIALWNS